MGQKHMQSRQSSQQQANHTRTRGKGRDKGHEHKDGELLYIDHSSVQPQIQHNQLDETSGGFEAEGKCQGPGATTGSSLRNNFLLPLFPLVHLYERPVHAFA